MALFKANVRSEFGSRRARRLREKGQIPGIIYGHGEEPMPVTLDRHEVEVAVRHGERLLEIDLDGRQENVLFKDVQYDPLGEKILHVDLARVSLDERVKVTVPIELRGTPAGAAEDGVLQQIAAEVSIECVVTAIPDDVRVSVSHMRVGDQLCMRDLPLPEGASLVSDPDEMVCSVVVLAEELAEAPAEAPAEPEVIGEKKERAEEAEEAADEK